LSSCLLLIALFPSAYAACNITGINQQTIPGLNDLRTATPFTFTLSVAASNCATAPLTLTDSLTWDVDGTPFPAASPIIVTYTNAAPAISYLIATFPGMIVTSLTPGEPITLVDQFGDENTYYVPLTAIPYTPPSTSSGTSATSTQPSPSASQTSPSPSSSAPAKSSVPIGGIVAGAVVGGIVIAAIIAFVWYKVRINHQRNSTRVFVDNFNQAPVPSTGDITEPEKSINAGYDIPNNPGVGVGEAVPSGRIQYPL